MYISSLWRLDHYCCLFSFVTAPSLYNFRSVNRINYITFVLLRKRMRKVWYIEHPAGNISRGQLKKMLLKFSKTMNGLHVCLKKSWLEINSKCWCPLVEPAWLRESQSRTATIWENPFSTSKWSDIGHSTPKLIHMLRSTLSLSELFDFQAVGVTFSGMITQIMK